MNQGEPTFPMLSLSGGEVISGKERERYIMPNSGSGDGGGGN